MQGVTDWRANRERLAVTFIGGAVEGVQQLGSTLAAMLPQLRAFAELPLAALLRPPRSQHWTKVVSVFFRPRAPRARFILTAQIRAVMAQLVAATGGIYAIVAAVGTLVAVLFTLSAANTEAAMATERLRAAEAAMDGEARAPRDKARAAALHGAQQATLADFQVQLQASGKLTNALERQLDALAGLSDEQIAAGLAAGDLFGDDDRRHAGGAGPRHQPGAAGTSSWTKAAPSTRLSSWRSTAAVRPRPACSASWTTCAGRWSSAARRSQRARVEPRPTRW